MQWTASAPVFALVLATALVAVEARAQPQPAAPRVAPVTPSRFDGALEARRGRLAAGLKPGVRPKLDAAIQEVLKRAQPPAAGKPAPSVDLMAAARGAVGEAGQLQGGDIEALAFLVLIEAAKSADEDLKAIMAEVKARNAKKAALRAALQALQSSRAATGSTKACVTFSCLDALPASPDYTRSDLDAVKQTLARIADEKREVSTNEMSDFESMRLQMAMDRMSKMMSTLSNLLKKVSDTSSQITQNLK